MVHYKTNPVNEDIRTFSDVPHSSFFDVVMYGVTNPHPDYSLYLNPHRYHVFEYIVSGKGYIDCGGEHITVSAGDFYYLRQGFIGHYFADRDDPYKKLWVNARGTLCDNLTEAYGIRTSVLVCHNMHSAHGIIEGMHKRLDASDGRSHLEVMQECTSDIFKLLSDAAGLQKLEETQYIQSQIDECRQYIRDNVFEPFDLNSLAKKFGLAPSYLIRKFKAQTGITPMRYYNMCRIGAARRMLASGRSVKSVALALKYADAAYFSGCFKAATGFMPSEYTQNIHIDYLAAKGTFEDPVTHTYVNFPQV